MSGLLKNHEFAKGIYWGIGAGGLLGVVGLVLIASNGWLDLEIRHWSTLESTLDWLGNNMGSALFPFALVIVFHCWGQLKLRRLLLQKNVAVEKVAQTEHWLEILESLAFGIGVLWTAIGMRAALLEALGDPSGLDGGGSAILILEKLVSGGILVALSTTIAGGMIGYLLRLLRIYTLGLKIRSFYEKIDKKQTRILLAALSRIENAVNKSPKLPMDKQLGKS